MSDKFPDDTFLARWMAGTLTEKERETFEAQAEFADYQRIIEQIEQLKIPDFDEAKALKYIREEKQEKVTRKTSKLWLWSAAATILLLLAWWFWPTPKTAPLQYRTALQEQRQIELPDQSRVVLNAESQLRLDPNNWETKKVVNLQGEAFFDVTSGQRFTVNTAQGSVQVLGTQFNVRQRDNSFEVLCYEGLVAVEHEGKEWALDAGTYFVITSRTPVDTGRLEQLSAQPEWIDGQTTYRSWPAKKVMEEVCRQYGKRLQWAATSDNTISGGFPHDNLDVALRIVCQSANLSCSLNNDRTIIQVVDAQ